MKAKKKKIETKIKYKFEYISLNSLILFSFAYYTLKVY